MRTFARYLCLNVGLCLAALSSPALAEESLAQGSLAQGSPARESQEQRSPAQESRGQRSPAQGLLFLPEYLGHVLDLHPKLLASRHKVSAADANVMSARGGFDLKLYAQGSHYPLGKYERTRGEVGVKQPTRVWGSEFWAKYENGLGYAPYDGGSVTSEWGKASIGVMVPLLQDGSIDERRLTVFQRELERDMAEHAVRQTQSDLLADAAHIWWKWYILGHKVRIYDSLVEQAEQHRAMLDELVQAGSVAPIETIDNQRTILSRRAQRAILLAEFSAAGIKVGLYRRDSRGTPKSAAHHELPDIHAPVVPKGLTPHELDSALNQNPMVGMYSAMLEVVEQELGLAKNQQLPRLDLSLAATHAAGDTRPYSSIDSSISETTVGGSLSFSLDVQRRKARGKAQALRAKRAQLEQELRLLRDSMRADFLAAQQALHAQVEAVEQSRAATELARQVAEAEAESLQAGQSTVMSVNIREQAVLTAQLAELEALHDLQSAWLEMQRALGKTEPEHYVMPATTASGTTALTIPPPPASQKGDTQ